MLLASLTAAWLRRLPFESKFRFSDLAFGPVERALSFQLDSAKQNTLIAAAECKAKLGFVPDYVAYRSQLANANREGDENANFWLCRTTGTPRSTLGWPSSLAAAEAKVRLGSPVGTRFAAS